MPNIEAPVTPRHQPKDLLALVSSASFTNGRSHPNTENAHARPLGHKQIPTSAIGLLSPTKHTREIANLLQEARCKYQANDFERDIVTWYTDIFSAENIERVKEKILAFQVDAVAVLPPGPKLPKMLGTVAQDVYRIIEWPENDVFRQFHQLVSYARLARHWTKLVNLSHDVTPDESKYMRNMATVDNPKKRSCINVRACY